jgi:hypothetical protein
MNLPGPMVLTKQLVPPHTMISRRRLVAVPFGDVGALLLARRELIEGATRFTVRAWPRSATSERCALERGPL